MAISAGCLPAPSCTTAFGCCTVFVAGGVCLGWLHVAVQEESDLNGNPSVSNDEVNLDGSRVWCVCVVIWLVPRQINSKHGMLILYLRWWSSFL